MADVLISEFMDKPTAEGLIAEYDVHWDPDLWGKRAELLEQVASARAIVVRNATQVDPELLDAAPNLKVVARMGVGLDNIDVPACKARGVEVCPAIGANAASVAEYVIATALILLRGPAYFATPDVVGGACWPQLIDALARGGRYTCAGAIAGPIVEMDLRTFYLRDLAFTGATIVPPGVFADLVGYIARGEIKPLLAASYPLEHLRDAQQAFIDKRHVGNFVVIMGAAP